MAVPHYVILCPRNTETGGPEALHQLGAALIASGHQAAMHYLPARASNQCPPRYLHYGVPVVPHFADRADVVVVIPEVMTDWVWRLHHAQPLIWWLSVAFYRQRPKKWTKRAKLWLRERLPSRRPYTFQPLPRLKHVYHGEYVRRFLAGKGVADALPLCEYLSPAFLLHEAEVPSAPRRDVCLYNPRKGLAFTQRVIEACARTGIEFVPLAGYGEDALRGLFGSSKLYIDFGEHPGRDRLPREAAACGCIVFTGLRGSAGNPVDVPLPPFYKLDEEQPGTLEALRTRLLQVIGAYDVHRQAQCDYRQWIRSLPQAFAADVAGVVEALSPRR
jgi:hypothetical protein